MTKTDLLNRLSMQMAAGEIESTMAAGEIMDHAFMLTQYAKYNSVSYDELSEYIITEIMEDPAISEINDYCINSRYNEYFEKLETDNIDQALADWTPSDIISSIKAGSFSWLDDYYYIDDLGNIQTCDYQEIYNLFGKETKSYLLDNEYYRDSDIDDIKENADLIISTCNQLIAIGY